MEKMHKLNDSTQAIWKNIFWVMNRPTLQMITSAKDVIVVVSLFVCLSVCLSVSNFAQKLPNGFAWNFQERLAMGQWTHDYILMTIRITDQDQIRIRIRPSALSYYCFGMWVLRVVCICPITFLTLPASQLLNFDLNTVQILPQHG